MKNTKLIKILLTVLTIVLAIVIPIWVGPESINGTKTWLIIEWFFGMLKIVGMIVVGYIAWYIFSIIYELWDDLID